MAALRSGIKRVLLPSMNAMDIERLPDEVRAGVEMVPVETMDQVLREALVRRASKERASDVLSPGTHGLGTRIT